MRFFILRTSVFFLLLLLNGCKKQLPEYVAIQYDELPDQIDYNIHVKPILSDKCYLCHGPDEGTRKAELRFDTENGLFKKSENGNFPIKPGNLYRSEAISRILTDDSFYIMPPKNSHLELSAREKAIIVKWVEQGAHWKKHWAFIPLKKPKVPPSENSWSTKNEIDQFIYEKLVKNNLHPSNRANKERLLKRVSIDLTGLPPTLTEINNFLKDTSEQAYEKVVNRLLNSDAYAERMTLEWLDVARYSDSNGYHADGSRIMWPWRDWVIQAFRNNKSYKEFVTEQLAGDLLPNATKEQVLATAFNRNHPINTESGAISEEFRIQNVADRTNTFGTAFLGLTMECAKCHDHKFDPISQKDYYQLFSFFNNINEVGVSGKDGNTGPQMLLTNNILDTKINEINNKIDSLSAIVKSHKSDNSKVSKKKTSLLNHSFELIEPDNKTIKVDKNSKTLASIGVSLEKGIVGMAAKFDHQYDHIKLNGVKSFQSYEPFSIAVWIHPSLLPTAPRTMTIIGNSSVKNQFFKGWDISIDQKGQISTRLVSSLPSNYFHVKTLASIAAKTWSHLLVTYDGSAKASGITTYINGEKVTSKIIFDNLYKSIVPKEHKIMLGKSPRTSTKDNGIYSGLIDELAIFDVEILPEQVVHNYNRSKFQNLDEIVISNNRHLASLQANLKVMRENKFKTIDTVTEVMVMEEMPIPRKTYLLNRGAYNSPVERVYAGTPESILKFDENLPKNRLGLSKWLFDEKNPLTARVTVNRYWGMIFGKGLVSSVNDFGNQGALPTHSDLLDWLAIEFIESNWDIKKLIKTLVLSNTYTQSSITSNALKEVDPENNYLSRAPSYRLQAENIRDIALFTSGLLNEKIGGKSVKPYQPKGLWIEKGNFSEDLLYFKQDHNENQYRKSMYTFHRRTSPPPYMTIFNMASRDLCAVSREQTNTPLQALSLLNDPQFIEAAKVLAYRMINEGGDSINDKIKTGFLLTLSRNPKKEELQIMNDLYTEELDNFKKDKNKANSFLAIGDYELPKNLPVSEVAAMTIVANTLFNMDEMYTKR